MNTVGEETGELEKTLNTIAGYYDSELEQATADALAKLEPAILVVLCRCCRLYRHLHVHGHVYDVQFHVIFTTVHIYVIFPFVTLLFLQ